MNGELTGWFLFVPAVFATFLDASYGEHEKNSQKHSKALSEAGLQTRARRAYSEGAAFDWSS